MVPIVYHPRYNRLERFHPFDVRPTMRKIRIYRQVSPSSSRIKIWGQGSNLRPVG